MSATTWHCSRCGLVLKGGYIYRGTERPEHPHPLEELSEASGTIIREGAQTWCSLGWRRDGQLLARAVDHFGAGSSWRGSVTRAPKHMAPPKGWVQESPQLGLFAGRG